MSDKPEAGAAKSIIDAAARESYEYRGRTLSVHPAAHIFPEVTGELFDDFCKDVEARGVRRPIVVRGDQIIDGRTRVRAALKVGRSIDFEVLPDDEDAFQFVISSNIHRRHMTPTQRAVAARTLSAVTEYLGKPTTAKLVKSSDPPARSNVPKLKPPGESDESDAVPERPSAVNPTPSGGSSPRKRSASDSGPAPPSSDELRVGTGRSGPELEDDGAPPTVVREAGTAPVTVAEAAKTFGVSQRSAERAARIEKKAPEVVSALADGSATLRDADSPEVIGASPEAREKAVAAVKAGEAGSLREALGGSGGQPAGGRKRRRTAAPGGNQRSGESDGDLDLPSLGGLPGLSGQPSPAPVSVLDPAKDPETAVEIYSPRSLLAVVRTIMQGIDLDAASSDEAQIAVQAGEFYSPSNDGIGLPWKPRTYCFPPLSRVGEFADKAVKEILSGHVPACFVAPSVTGSEWAQRLLGLDALSMVVFRRGSEPFITAPAVSGSRAGVWRAPQGMILYVFGVPPTEEVVDVVSVWGVPLKRAAA